MAMTWSQRSQYVHEHWATALLATAPFVASVFSSVRFSWLFRNLFENLPGIRWSNALFPLEVIAGDVISGVETPLLAAIFITSVRIIYRNFRHRPVARRQLFALNSRLAFVFVWFILLAGTVVAGDLLFWSSFAAWLTESVPPDFLMW